MADNFKKLEIWREAVRLVEVIYKTTGEFLKEEIYGLTSQMRRSAVSVAGNIAEASGRFGYKDKVHFLVVARGSLEETRSHLLIAEKLGYVEKSQTEKIDEEYEVLVKKINSFIGSIKEKTN